MSLPINDLIPQLIGFRCPSPSSFILVNSLIGKESFLEFWRVQGFEDVLRHDRVTFFLPCFSHSLGCLILAIILMLHPVVRVDEISNRIMLQMQRGAVHS